MHALNMLLSAVLALSLCCKGNSQRLSRPTPDPFQLSLGLGESPARKCRPGMTNQCYHGCPISCENVMNLPSNCRDESCKTRQCVCFSGFIEKSRSDRTCVPVSECRKGRWTIWTSWGSCSKTCGKGVRKRRRQCSRGGVCVGRSDEIRGCHLRSCRGSKPCDRIGCEPDATCRSRGSNVDCICNKGFKKGNRPEDVCQRLLPCDNNRCHAQASCENVGPYHFICTCNKGYTGNGTICKRTITIEKDPCNPSPCDRNAFCRNAFGSRYICTCKSGFTGNGRTCEEIKPCDSSPCDPNAFCRNAFGGRYICTCKQGFTGNGRTCEEIKPCDSSPCDPNAFCRNAFGGRYICTCKSGFTGNGRTCEEIPLCDSNPCDPNASCEDANGEFIICKCNEGYTGDGWKCESISCDEPSWCPQLQDFCVRNKVINRNCPATCQGCITVSDDGIWGIWTAWGLCDVTCGEGLRRRTRKCSKRQGACVGSSQETKECDPAPPPCKGTWDPWSDWGRCDVKCGGGAHERRRSCQGPGTCPGGASESKECNTNQCEWSAWTRWSECDVTCGDGMRSRLRSCPEPGQCVGEPTKTRKCSKQACEGTWTLWTSWGDCDVTCGEGKMVRTRKCQGPGICVERALETRKCNVAPCQEQGQWDPWTKWSRCNTDCESKRSRLCRGPGPGGCVGAASQTRTCKTGSCQGWSECSKSCGGGERSRKRCIFASLCSTTFKDCNTQTCESGSSLCKTNPCKNGGVCEQSGSSYNCVCPSGFAGRNCDQETHPCDEKPCRNGGTCKKSGSEYTCVCKPRYSGLHCDDECKGEWTPWFDRDDPNGGGDNEDLTLIRKDFPLKACITPTVIDARVVKSRTHWAKSGDVVSVTAEDGLTCKNEEQKPGSSCKDYEVRFCCPKIENRKEVELVAKNFRRAILSLAATDRRASPFWSSWTDEDCDRRVLDSSRRSRMIGRGCPARRTKRQTGDDQEITKRDILFLIDESVSVGHTYFKKFLRLVQAILTYFCGDIDIGEDKTRISVMTFDFGQHPHLSFDDSYRKEELLQAVGNIEYNRSTAGFTCLADGLKYAKDEMFQASQGARLQDGKTEQVIYLLSDGCTYCRPKVDSTAELRDAASELTDREISIITFLVGTHSEECIKELISLMDGTRCYQSYEFKSWDEVDVAIDGFETTDCANSWETSKLSECDDDQPINGE